MKRKLDTRESLRVVTSNKIITAKNIATMGIKARKLLYIAMAQCRITDKEFFEYSISIPEFSKLMGIEPTHVYQEAPDITSELLTSIIEIREGEKKGYKQCPLFASCVYVPGSGMIDFELNPKMSEFLLNLRKDFTKTLLHDLLKMKSQYSMSIWNLMQREMGSLKPGVFEVIEFDLSLEEIRRVTGTEKKFERISDIKRYVIDLAINDIRESCGVCLTYTNIKRGRFITGFRFMAVSEYHLERPDPSEIPPERLAEIERKAQELRDKEAQRAKENA